MEGRIIYFDEPGRNNTPLTLEAVRRRAEELGIRQVLVATTHGYTALKAADALHDLDVEIIAVSICAAFQEQDWTMIPKERKELEERGVKVLTSLHSLGNDINEAFDQMPPNRIVRETLYRFCQGMKVAVEIAVMAADAGLGKVIGNHGNKKRFTIFFHHPLPEGSLRILFKPVQHIFLKGTCKITWIKRIN